MTFGPCSASAQVTAANTATGAKRMRPDSVVFTLQGDGDMVNEGLQEVLVAVLVLLGVLIALFFMHLRGAAALLRIAAVTGLLWLALLFGLSGTDFGTRTSAPAPIDARR